MAFYYKNMYRKSFAIFFTVLLMALTAAPTVLSVIDDSVDISMFFSTSEEEEKETKTIKDLKLLFSEYNTDFTLANTTNNKFGYCFKKYAKPHLNLISPPPEQNII